ncbi:MAG: hypothetical protein KDC24_00035 [Saprospiraceae bacterium]|nr:hypothetical protein [Saprospiraceae bacterium]
MKTYKTYCMPLLAFFILSIFPYNFGYSQSVIFCGGELDEAPCTGEVDLVPEEDPNCSIESLSWILDLNADTFQNVDEVGVNALQGRFPLGTHTVKFLIKGTCGEERTVEKTFEVIDCTPPEVTCYFGLFIDIHSTLGTEIWAEDFINEFFDNCSGQNYEARMNLVEDNNEDGTIDSLDYLQGPPKFENALLKCKDVGTTRLVQLWVSDVSNDTINNWSNCITTIGVRDNLNFCGEQLILQGRVRNYFQNPLANVSILNYGTGFFAETDSLGRFYYADPFYGYNYFLSAEKTSSALNGVTTFDLALIGKYILGQNTLSTPYQLIAADVNQSGTITTLDLIQIQKIILGLEENFPGDLNWIFIPEEYEFPDPKNPWEYETEIIRYNLYNHQFALNFVGVKLGDVNGSTQ